MSRDHSETNLFQKRVKNHKDSQSAYTLAVSLVVGIKEMLSQIKDYYSLTPAGIDGQKEL